MRARRRHVARIQIATVPATVDAPTLPQLKRIFISYRRGDSSVFTARLYDRLTAFFGQGAVFLDIDSIPAGATDFRQVVREQIAKSGVVLAVIGRSWAGPSSVERRIDDPNDHVRIEIEYAISSGRVIIPVYCDTDEVLTASRVPLTLEPLTWMNAAFVETGPDFEQQIRRLRRRIEEVVLPSFPRRLEHRARRLAIQHRLWLTGVLVTVLVSIAYRDSLAAEVISKRALLRVLGREDGLAFSNATPENAEVIRGFPDRESLINNTEIADTIAESRATFDLFALSATAFYTNPEALRTALRNNVAFRIVVIDTSEENRANLQAFFSKCSQDGTGMQWQMNSADAGIATFLSIDAEARKAGRGSIAIRTWKGPFLNSLWVRDGYRDDGIAHVELTYYGDAIRNPAIRIGTLGGQMRRSLQAQFEYIWQHATPVE